MNSTATHGAKACISSGTSNATLWLAPLMEMARAVPAEACLVASGRTVEAAGHALAEPWGSRLNALVGRGDALTGATLRRLALTGLLDRLRVAPHGGEQRLLVDGQPVESLDAALRAALRLNYEAAKTKGLALVFRTRDRRLHAILEDGTRHEVDRLARALVAPGGLYRGYVTGPWKENGRTFFVPLPDEVVMDPATLRRTFPARVSPNVLDQALARAEANVAQLVRAGAVVLAEVAAA